MKEGASRNLIVRSLTLAKSPRGMTTKREATKGGAATAWYPPVRSVEQGGGKTKVDHDVKGSKDGVRTATRSNRGGVDWRPKDGSTGVMARRRTSEGAGGKLGDQRHTLACHEALYVRYPSGL